MTTLLPARLIDIGVDWLTLTTKDAERGIEWKDAFRSVATKEQVKGHKWQKSRWLGYEGESCGPIFVGKGVNGWLVRISSNLAEEVGSLFSPDAVHCTRIDLQVTAEMPRPMASLIERMYDAALTSKPKNGRPPNYTLLKQSDGARTLYVGSRTSGLYGRVYDKGMEQALGEPGKLVRWELECKDWAADQAVALIYGSPMPDASMCSLIGQFFTERSIPVAWSYVRPDESFHVPRITADDAASIKWLRGPVAGVVARLMETCGPEQTFRALLGKWREGNTDSDIINRLADVCASYAEMWDASIPEVS